MKNLGFKERPRQKKNNKTKRRLGILGTTVLVVGLALSFHMCDNKKTQEQAKAKEKPEVVLKEGKKQVPTRQPPKTQIREIPEEKISEDKELLDYIKEEFKPESFKCRMMSREEALEIIKKTDPYDQPVSSYMWEEESYPDDLSLDGENFSDTIQAEINSLNGEKKLRTLISIMHYLSSLNLEFMNPESDSTLNYELYEMFIGDEEMVHDPFCMNRHVFAQDLWRYVLLELPEGLLNNPSYVTPVLEKLTKDQQSKLLKACAEHCFILADLDQSSIEEFYLSLPPSSRSEFLEKLKVTSLESVDILSSIERQISEMELNLSRLENDEYFYLIRHSEGEKLYSIIHHDYFTRPEFHEKYNVLLQEAKIYSEDLDTRTGEVDELIGKLESLEGQ